ncbi:MAG TPA: ABC transporter substrate-binding protein [Candidatus Saccharimonadales bacterium]
MDKKKGWKQFQKIQFDSAKLSRRARKMETATTRHAHKFILKRLANLRDARNHIILWLSLVAVLIGAVMVQLVWYETSYHKSAAVSGGTYAEAVKGDISTLNPLYARTDAELTARKLLFSGLFDYDKSGHLRNDLAESMSVGDQRRLYTVTLKPDLKWSDGTKLTAKDIIFTVELMKNPAARAIMQQSWRDVTVRAIDERTVEFKLPAAYAAFGDALTFAVLPEHMLREIDPSVLRENGFSLSPVGSGPFAFRFMQRVGENSDAAHKIIHFVANPSYHNGPIKLERFELHAYEESKAMTDAVVMHDVNAVIDIDHTVAAEKLPKDFTVHQQPINNGMYAFFNTASPLLKDVSLRRALLAGTDTHLLKKSVAPYAPELKAPFIPNQIDEPQSFSYLAPYNVRAAGDQLTKLGWKISADGIRKKKRQSLVLRIVVNKESHYSALAHELARQWKTLGVEASVVEFEQQAGGQGFAQSVLQPRAYDVLINELIIGADPDVFAYWHSSQANSSGLNFSNYKNKLADDILVSARQRDEVSLRNEKYKAFAKVWSRDVPAIPLYQSTFLYAHTKKTATFDNDAIMPSPTDRLAGISYWTADRGRVYKTP